MGNVKVNAKTQSGYEVYENVAQKAENAKHTAVKVETAKQKRENAEYAEACKQLDNYFTTGEFKPISLPIRQRQDKNHAGASYEYGDLFMRSATNGYLNDKGNDGLTVQDARSGGYKLAELQSHSDPYTNPYNHQGGAKSDYYTIATEEDLQKAYEAFGYTRAKAPQPKPQPKPEPKPVPQPAPQPQPVPEDKEKVAVTGKLTTKQILENGLVKAGFVKDGETVCVDFKGKLSPDESGEYVKKGKFTIKVSDDAQVPAHKVPDEYANKAKYKIENGKIFMSIDGVHRKGNIFHKREWQEVGPVDYTPNQEAAQEVDGAK